MIRDLQHKNPAVILAGRILGSPNPARDPAIEPWTDSKWDLLQRIRRAESRGEITVVGTWEQVPGWPGRYTVHVRRLRPPAPRWRAPLLWALGGLALLAGIAAVLYFVISTVLGALAMILGAVAVTVLVLLGIRSSGGGPISITQVVNIWR